GARSGPSARVLDGEDGIPRRDRSADGAGDAVDRDRHPRRADRARPLHARGARGADRDLQRPLVRVRRRRAHAQGALRARRRVLAAAEEGVLGDERDLQGLGGQLLRPRDELMAPTLKKLRYKPGMRVYLVDAPSGYEADVRAAGVERVTKLAGTVDLVHAF